MKKATLNAVTMQYILISAIVITLIGLVGIFVLAQTVLQNKALETDHRRIEAELAQEEIVRLQQLEKVLKENSADIEKTAKIAADSKQYDYQDQVIEDITGYARQQGIEILGFNFGDKPGTLSTTTGTSAQQRTALTVQLSNNIPYTSFIKFLKSLEVNVTRMQLTGIALQPNSENPKLIVGPSIEIEVFLR